MPLQPAILGTARLANFRLGSRSAALVALRRTKARITLAGVAGRVREAGLTVHDVLNDSPNTATLTIDGTETPVVQQQLRISINSDAPHLLFNGHLQTVDLTYELQPGQLAYPSSAIDDTAQANRRRPFGTWTNVSATTIGQYLATYAGLSTAGIAAALPTVSVNLDGREGFSGGMQQLSNLIGGYWKVEDGVAYLFLTDTTDAPDALDGTPGRLEDDPPIRMTTDSSQLTTRQTGKGHGEPTLSAVAAGETIVPVDQAGVWFGTVTPGGKAISETQVFAYAGVQVGGAGTVVGPAAAPVVAPLAGRVVGAGMTAGNHQLAYTFGTAAGESLPSPLSLVYTAETLASPVAPTVTPSASGFSGPAAGASIRYVATLGNGAGETTAGTISVAVTALGGVVIVMQPVTAAMLGVVILFYRSDNGGAFGYVGGNTVTAAHVSGGQCGIADTQITPGAAPPGVNTASFFQASLSAIALGPSGTTSRKIYMTEAGGSQLKLQQTIANNTATVAVTIATPDGSLGANAPTSDTSGLSTVAGQVLAGSPSLLTAGWPFATEGWAMNGQQMIRYTGITGNTLTGIPTSGLGSIVNTIKYGEHIDAAPALTGVTGLTTPLLQGAPVNVWVQRDDLAAQGDQAIIDLANGRVPADGIWEGPPISDERRKEASLIALCDAHLALFSRPIVTVTYTCRDMKTASGKTIHIDLTNPIPIGPIDLTIQSVDISEIDVFPGTAPRYSVVASSVRFSLEDLLRRLLAAKAA